MFFPATHRDGLAANANAGPDGYAYINADAGSHRNTHPNANPCPNADAATHRHAASDTATGANRGMRQPSNGD